MVKKVFISKLKVVAKENNLFPLKQIEARA